MNQARRAAAVLVAEVLERRRTLDEAMADTKSFNALAGRDRAFARAIASATLRRLGTVDRALEAFLAKPLNEDAGLARAILRTGAAQILVLNSPPHAAVSESVELARAAPSAAAFAGLINAVLRRIAADKERLAETPAETDLPAWLYARWRVAYGEAAPRIAAALRAEPPLDLTVKSEPAAWADRLGGTWLGGASVRLAENADVTALPGFADGEWWVQDAAAAKVAPLLGDVASLEVLDLCAAPGGKTLQLAAADAKVTALDVSAQRLERVAENLARTKLSAEIVCADALTWEPPKRYDAALLDAPCSATGTLRRHPEAAWLRRPTDLAALADLQARLLDRAMTFVRPEGTLVYAVCSLEPEEGEGAVAAALARHGGRLEPLRELRTTPADDGERGGMDGFYACALRVRG